MIYFISKIFFVFKSIMPKNVKIIEDAFGWNKIRLAESSWRVIIFSEYQSTRI